MDDSPFTGWLVEDTSFGTGASQNATVKYINDVLNFIFQNGDIHLI